MNQDFRDLFAGSNAFRIEFLSFHVTRFAGQDVSALSREHLVRNKCASGRTQDLADLEALEG